MPARARSSFISAMRPPATVDEQLTPTSCVQAGSPALFSLRGCQADALPPPALLWKSLGRDIYIHPVGGRGSPASGGGALKAPSYFQGGRETEIPLPDVGLSIPLTPSPLPHLFASEFTDFFQGSEQRLKHGLNEDFVCGLPEEQCAPEEDQAWLCP